MSLLFLCPLICQVVDDEADKSTMSQSIFNLVKNIMGAGMLSLPSGVAAFSDSRYLRDLRSAGLREGGATELKSGRQR